MYSFEEEEQLIELYLQGISVEDLALKFNRNTNSIIAKLVQLKVYVKPPKRKKKTAKEMYREIEEITGLKFESPNFTKKKDIKALVEWLRMRT